MKWEYGAHSIDGNIDTATSWINANHPEWDVVTMTYELLTTLPSYTVIIYRLPLEDDTKKVSEKIKSLEGEVKFHKGETDHWRKAFEEQRGGEAYNSIQRNYADSVSEIAKLNLEIKKLKAMTQEREG
jgi:hypothetical protein